MAGQMLRRVASPPGMLSSSSGVSGSTIDSTGTWMRRSSGLRTPTSTMVHSRVGPTRKRATSSSGFCVADSPMRCTSRPACSASRSRLSARCEPRFVCATAWTSSTITHWVPANSRCACEVSMRYSDSGVVMRMSGGDFSISRRSRCGVSPVRTATRTSAPMPRSGARRLRSTS